MLCLSNIQGDSKIKSTNFRMCSTCKKIDKSYLVFWLSQHLYRITASRKWKINGSFFLIHFLLAHPIIQFFEHLIYKWWHVKLCNQIFHTSFQKRGVNNLYGFLIKPSFWNCLIIFLKSLVHIQKKSFYGIKQFMNKQVLRQKFLRVVKTSLVKRGIKNLIAHHL